MFVGYVCVLIFGQDFVVQWDGFYLFGVDFENVYVDYGMIGMNCECLGFCEVFVVVCKGDVLVVIKFDCFVRLFFDVCDIVDELMCKGVMLNFGGFVYDLIDFVG